jgi:hypothetical protein
MLSLAQKRQFYEEGYLKIAGAVPKVLVDEALRSVNHSIGTVGLGGEDMANNRSAFHCAELMEAPVILDLYNKSPIIEIAEELMGKGNVLPVVKAKPYPRFPLAPGEDAPELRGHLDGIGSGTNGMPKGYYGRGFTAFAVVYLADLLDPYAGNFTVWPKSHRAYEAYFQEVGHETLAQGMPRIDLPAEPVMVTGKAGDLILAHHQMFHTGGPNASPNVRQAVIARLRHKDVEGNEYAAYADIWREWPGISAAVSGESEAMPSL